MNINRHLDLVKGVDFTEQIHIIGCGSIGTATATTLVRLGFENFVLWDDDIVEEHNVANQYFEHNDIGRPKTLALAIKMKLINKEVHIKRKERVTDEDNIKNNFKSQGTILSCVDSMASRDIILDMVSFREKYIEARMGGEEGHVFSAYNNYESLNKYKFDHIFSDEEASQEACTSRSTIYNVNIIGSVIAKHLIRLHQQEEHQHYYHTVIDMNNIEMTNINNN